MQDIPIGYVIILLIITFHLGSSYERQNQEKKDKINRAIIQAAEELNKQKTTSPPPPPVPHPSQPTYTDIINLTPDDLAVAHMLK